MSNADHMKVAITEITLKPSLSSERGHSDLGIPVFWVPPYPNP